MADFSGEGASRSFTALELETLAKAANIDYLSLLQPGEHGFSGERAVIEFSGAYSEGHGYAPMDPRLGVHAPGVPEIVGTEVVPATTQVLSGQAQEHVVFQHKLKKRRLSAGAQALQQQPLSSLLQELERTLTSLSSAMGHLGDVAGLLKTVEILPACLAVLWKLHARGSINKVREDELRHYLELLEFLVNLGPTALDVDTPMESQEAQLVEVVLQAANAALLILTSEGLSKALLREELVDKIVDVVSLNIEHTVLPSYDPWRKEKTDDLLPLARCATLKGRTKGKGQLGRGSAVGAHFLGRACTLLPLVSSLLTMVKLHDSAISRLSRTALSTFSVTSLFELQAKALQLLASVFLSYPQHHLLVLDEVVQLLWKVPLNKKQPRCFFLKADSLQIHTMSALVLHLIQSTVQATCLGPAPESYHCSRTEKGPCSSSGMGEVDVQKMYEHTEDAARSFWRGLLVKCAALKGAGEMTDARTTIEELMDDFLHVASTPEFPAAGFLLEILSRSLASDLGLKSDNLGTRGMAIDLLGRLTVKLKQDDLLMKTAETSTAYWLTDCTQIKSSAGQPLLPSSQCYICLEVSSALNLLSCQDCSRSGHVSCLGLEGVEELTSAWKCHVCSAKTRLQIITGESFVPDSRLVLEQLVVDYLLESSSAESLSALRFLSAMLAKDSRGLQQWVTVSQSWASSLHEHQDQTVAIPTLPRGVILKATRLLEAGRPLARSFDALVTCLLGCFHDKTLNRQKAMKAVSSIVEADPSELAKDHVREYVEQRLSDSSISVREVALDLVGKHLLQQPELAEKYYPVICDRIKDTGTSVRKRAIRIIRDLCLQSQDFPHSVDACVKIFTRFNDDEASIRDLVLKTLHELWFESRENSDETVEQMVHRATCQMVEVLKQPRSQAAVIASIKQSIFDELAKKPAENNGQLQRFTIRGGSTHALKANAAVRERCEKMCKHLQQSFLQMVEGAGNYQSILSYLVALQVFCEVDPRLCAPNKDSSTVVALLPFLRSLVESGVKNQGSSEGQDPAVHARMVETCLGILTSLIPHVPRLQQAQLDSLQKSLSRFIFQTEQLSVVQAAVRCFCKLQDVCGTKTPLQQFYEVAKRLYASLQGSSATNSAPRCLFSLGLFCRFGAKHLDADTSGVLSVSQITSTFKGLYRSGQRLVTLKALQALGNVCVAEPGEMESNDIVEAYSSCLQPDASTSLQVQVLKNLCEFALISEEKPSQQSSDSQDDGSVVVAVAAGANDTVTASGPIQRHWSAVLSCLLRPSSEVQQNALKLVEIALGQGIVFPVTCVGHLIALSADEVEAVSSSAMRLLQLINVRWSSYKFVESKFAEGFRAAYAQLQPKMAQLKDQGFPPYARQGLGKVYRMVRPSSSTKQNVLTSLIRRFDCEDSKAQLDLHYLAFCAEVFASLPYEFLDEVLFVVAEASKIIHKRGGTLQTQLHKCIGPDGPLAAQARVAYEQLTGKQAEGSSKGNADSAPNLDSCHDALQQALVDAEAAGAICLLLLLKAYLKEAYNLAEAKCLAYGHSETLKFQEHVTRKDTPVPEFHRIGSGFADKMCNVVFFYQKLKNLMSQETDKDLTALVSSSPKGRRRASLPTGGANDSQSGAGNQSAVADLVAHSAPPKRPNSRKRFLQGEQVPFPDHHLATSAAHSPPQIQHGHQNGELGKRRKRSSAKHRITTESNRQLQ